MNNKIPNYHKFLLIITGLVLVWSAINPHDYFTWFLEVLPALLGFVAIAITYKKFPLTNLVYTLISLHSIILMIGGHSTYAEVPLFNWLRDVGVFERNNYDKIGHLAQGFMPAIVIREVLLRTSPLKPGKWLSFIIISITGLITAIYEIIEWWVSLATGSAGDSFLGTQGYIWDTQSDMALCLLGSMISLILLSQVHDRKLEELLCPKK